MSRRAYTESKTLLASLLDGFEAKPSVRRHIAYVDYDGFKNIAEQDRLIRELREAERSGAVEIRRRRVSGADILAHVLLKDPVTLYRHLDRIPATVNVDNALVRVRSRSGLPATAVDTFDALAGAWARGVSSFGLKPGNVAGLLESLDLVLAVQQRAVDPAPSLLDYRTFSRGAGVRSKALEQRTATVIALLARLYPDLVESGLDPAESLAMWGITRLPQPLLASGPLAMDGKPLPDVDYWGVPAEVNDRLALSSPVNYLLTIENYASFVRHVREINGTRDGLIIYTGGFPARPILRQIVRLAVQASAPAFHWGDIDAGGLLIFRHLEKALAEVGFKLNPHMMRLAGC